MTLPSVSSPKPHLGDGEGVGHLQTAHSPLPFLSNREGNIPFWFCFHISIGFTVISLLHIKQ